MPAPTASQIEGLANAALSARALQGQDAPGLAKALAQSCAQALSLFLAQAQVLPGIPAALDPLSGSGSTAGPGMLLPPPAGGPGAQSLEGLALAALQSEGIRGENAADLARVIAGSIAQGIMLFTAQVQVMPGILVAGFVSIAPGRLM